MPNTFTTLFLALTVIPPPPAGCPHNSSCGHTSFGNPDAGSGQFLNTGLTTAVNFGKPVLEAVSHLVTGHEIGHNWGSAHDGSTDNAACTPSGNNYLMFPTAVDGSGSNNNKFSECSIDAITAVIVTKGSCFEAPPPGVCGNFVVSVAAIVRLRPFGMSYSLFRIVRWRIGYFPCHSAFTGDLHLAFPAYLTPCLLFALLPGGTRQRRGV